MNKLKVQVNARTWLRDSYGLYDYEAQNIKKQKLNIQNSGYIYREQTNIFFLSSKDFKQFMKENPNRNNIEILCRVKQREQYCMLQQIQSEEQKRDEQQNQSQMFNNDIWMILSQKCNKKLKQKQMFVNSEFKLGRISFKILDIRIIIQDSNDITYSNFIMNQLKQHYNEQSNLMQNECTIYQKMQSNCDQNLETQHTQKIHSTLDCIQQSYFEKQDKSNSIQLLACRFCLQETETDDDPLLSVCQCSGSMRFIHYECLKFWLNSKIDLKKNKGVVSVLWSKLICELCKQKFPLTIHKNQHKYDLIDFQDIKKTNNKQNQSSLILESFNKDGVQDGLHFIDFNERDHIIIGRGSEAHIRLNDISVSRNHCKVKLVNNQIYLEDLSSKFGTLVRPKEDVRIEQNQQQFLQIGRTCFEFDATKRSISSFFSCFSCFQDNIQSQEIQKNDSEANKNILNSQNQINNNNNNQRITLLN